MPDSSSSSRSSTRSAYLVGPPGDDLEGPQHPGVLLLHSWWGLTPSIRSLCDRVADDGFVVLAPDLLGGQTPTTEPDAELLLRDRDMNETADLVVSSARTLRSLPITSDAPIGVVGLSMGASLALWLATRAAEHIGAVSVFYGSQDIDFMGATAAVQGHFAEHDPFVSDDDRTELQAHLHLVGLEPEFHHYPGTRHWFFERDQDAYDEPAAALAYRRMVAFLHANLDAADPQ